MGVACGTYGGEERCIRGFGEETQGKEPLGRHRHKWKDNIELNLQELGRGAWTGFIWLRTGIDSGLLWRWVWTFGFHKMRGSSWGSWGGEEGPCALKFSVLVASCFTLPYPVCLPACCCRTTRLARLPLFFRCMRCEGMRCEPSHRPTPASIPLEWTWTVAYQWYLCRGAGCRWWTRKFAILTCTQAITLFGASVSAVLTLQFMFVETFYLIARVLYYLYQSCMLIESVPFEVDNRP